MKFQVERQTKILPISAIQICEIWDKYRAFKNWDTLKRRSLCSVKFEKFEKLAPETVVYKCLKNHQKQGVRQFALELQKEVPILLNEKVPSFQELYNPAVHPRKILVQTDQTRQRLNLEENSSTSPLLHGIMSKKGMFERRESAGSGSSLTGAADHYPKQISRN